MQTRSKSGISKLKQFLSLNTSIVGLKPTSFSQASKDHNWRDVMADEFNALLANETQDLLPSQPRQNLGFIESSLVSMRTWKRTRHSCLFYNHQQAGIDYHETFSLIAKPPTIHLVLSLVTTFGWAIRQLDFKNALVHDILTKEVYIKRPPRLLIPIIYMTFANPKRLYTDRLLEPCFTNSTISFDFMVLFAVRQIILCFCTLIDLLS